MRTKVNRILMHYKTYSFVNFTPPFNPLLNVPLPRPPAKTCALITNSFAMVFTERKTIVYKSSVSTKMRTQFFSSTFGILWILNDLKTLNIQVILLKNLLALIFMQTNPTSRLEMKNEFLTKGCFLST